MSPSGKISEAMVEAFAYEFIGVNVVTWLERHREDIRRALRAALSVPAPGTGGAPAFDPLKGGCPHCKWLDTNLGSVLDQKCYLHQKIEDLQVNAALERSVAQGVSKAMDAIHAALNIDREDDPLETIRELMEEASTPPAADLGAVKLDGPELWEIVFGVLKGDVPEELTDDAFAKIAAAINSAFPLSSSPVGEMVLVPREPTEAMYQASYSWFGSSAFNFGEMYRAMLAASPQGGR